MKIKKRFLLFACMLVMMFTLVSCGSSINEQSSVYGYSRSSIQDDMQSTAKTLSAISTKDAQAQANKYKEASEVASSDEKTTDVMYETVFQNWADNGDTLGSLEDFGSFKIEKAGKTVTATQAVKFSKRNGELVYTFNVIGDRMKLTSMNVNVDYTLKETMGKAALNVVMGMAVVFAILIIISLVIYAFRIIPYLQKKFSGEQEEKKEESTGAEPAEEAVEEDLSDDTELVAVIAAAIAASTGTTTDDFVVRSIKRRY